MAALCEYDSLWVGDGGEANRKAYWLTAHRHGGSICVKQCSEWAIILASLHIHCQLLNVFAKRDSARTHEQTPLPLRD